MGAAGSVGEFQKAFESDGYTVLPEVMPEAGCNELIGVIEANHETHRPGLRRWLRIEGVAKVARSLRTHPAIRPLLPQDARAVQCTLFTKDLDTNWSVTPHQDLSVPVRERVNATGWSAWCVKEGVTFAQPPQEILERLVAMRLQLDSGGEATGPLEVTPGSHAMGRLTASKISQLVSTKRVPCSVPKGGVLVMRPLLIHASGKLRGEGRRRVLHFLYGPPLDGGVSWLDAV